MSELKQIFDDAKGRLDILREYIARGAYDNEVKILNEKFQEIFTTSQENIRKKLYKHRGLFNRKKIQKKLNSAYEDIEDLVNKYTNDLDNRKILINYYNHKDIDDPNSCKNMSESKCIREDNISSCRWVHGGEKLGDYLPRREGETGPLTRFGDGSEPKGCYPISKSDTLRSLLNSKNSGETKGVSLSSREQAIMTLKPSQEENIQMSNENQASANLRQRESRRVLTNSQKKERGNKKKRHANDYKKMMARLKAMKTKPELTSVEKLNMALAKEGSKGGRKRKTRKKKTTRKKRKTRKRKIFQKKRRKKKPKKKSRKTAKKVDRVEEFLKNFRKYDGDISKLKKIYKK